MLTDINFTMPLKKTNPQTENQEQSDTEGTTDDNDPVDEDEGDDEDDEWIQDIGLHSDLRSKLYVLLNWQQVQKNYEFQW